MLQTHMQGTLYYIDSPVTLKTLIDDTFLSTKIRKIKLTFSNIVDTTLIQENS